MQNLIKGKCHVPRERERTEVQKGQKSQMGK